MVVQIGGSSLRIAMERMSGARSWLAGGTELDPGSVHHAAFPSP
jgi:hypothetical protein